MLESRVAEQVENQPAQGEIVGSVHDGVRKADAEDLRFEDRVERTPPPIESERVPPRDVPSADTELSLGEMVKTLLTRPTSTTRLTTRLTRVARIVLLLARVWALTLLRKMRMLT